MWGGDAAKSPLHPLYELQHRWLWPHHSIWQLMRVTIYRWRKTVLWFCHTFSSCYVYFSWVYFLTELLFWELCSFLNYLNLPHLQTYTASERGKAEPSAPKFKSLPLPGTFPSDQSTTGFLVNIHLTIHSAWQCFLIILSWIRPFCRKISYAMKEYKVPGLYYTTGKLKTLHLNHDTMQMLRLSRCARHFLVMLQPTRLFVL